MPYALRTIAAVGLLILALAVCPPVASANHQWSDYHWARSSNPFVVKLIANITSTWSSSLNWAASSWTQVSALDTSIIIGKTDDATRQSCVAAKGSVSVCNYTYGLTGWAGIANIYIDASHHITQATAKLNDSYGYPSGYREMAVCHEVGHTLGLAHLDENMTNTNLGSCMDYTNNPYGPPSNVGPGAHDHAQLNTIYTHLDGTPPPPPPPPKPRPRPKPKFGGRMLDSLDMSDAREWGQRVHVFADGREEVYERHFDDGSRILTFVHWVSY